MALFPKNGQDRPFGQFDLLDATMPKGGEVMTLVAVSTAPGTDKAAADVLDDGYVPDTSAVRPAASFATTGPLTPLFLADDGTAGYGVLFGVVVGAVAGQTSYGPGGGTNLGPPTFTGSGKCTLVCSPGLYGVSLDAVDTTAGGLIPSNTALTVGTALYYTSAGLLTTTANKVSGATQVGNLSEFETTGSMVTTQQFMVAALNSPSGDVSSLMQEQFYQAVFYWRP
jgi:hypothetical protein